MMLSKETQNKLKAIAAKYVDNIEVIFVDGPDHFLCQANGVDAYKNMSACGYNIEIGMYDDDDLAIAAFFHELGHVCGLLKGQSHSIDKIFDEATAWTVGFKIAFDHGYVYSFDSKEYAYARESLKSYIGGEYDGLAPYDLQEFMRMDKEMGRSDHEILRRGTGIWCSNCRGAQGACKCGLDEDELWD